MQDRQSREAGDARLRALSSGWIAKAIVVGCALTVICTLSVLHSGFRLTGDAGAQALSNDFRVFWSAGTLALRGEYLAIFDTDALTAVHNVNPDDWMPWLYPPGFFLLLMPFGALSYATGFAVLAVLSCLCMVVAVRPFVQGSKTAWLACSLHAALTLQVSGTVLAALSILVLWRTLQVGFEVETAALLSGSLVASPYIWHYEAAMMPAISLLHRAGVTAGRSAAPAFPCSSLAWVWVAGSGANRRPSSGLRELVFRHDAASAGPKRPRRLDVRHGETVNHA